MAFAEEHLRSQATRFAGNAVIVGDGRTPGELDRMAGATHFAVRLDEIASDLPERAATNCTFPASILASLLAASGFRRIVLAGIAESASNDLLFRELRRIKERDGVVFTSARFAQASVLIGAEPEQVLAEEVLKWSIETNTFLAVEFVRGGATSRDLFAEHGAGTPFSFQRLFLPQLAGHRGRGAYFDSDMLVFRDVYEIFHADMGGNVLVSCKATKGRPAQYSVFVVDNERALWDPDDIVQRYASGKLSYAQIMQQFCFAEPKAALLPMEWNSLEMYEERRTGNCHFTDMDSQPWLSTGNPYAFKWCEALLTACNDRPSVLAALETSLDRGWVRPSLKWQVHHESAHPQSIPPSVQDTDRTWVPPHRRARRARRSVTPEGLRRRLGAVANSICDFVRVRQ
jgi:hypothetical protein